MSEIYVPTDEDIDAVSFQVPDSVSREIIRATLILNSGDVTETVLNILTDDNVIPAPTSPKRSRPMQEVQEWNRFFKDLDKYSIEKNIDRMKPDQMRRQSEVVGELECSYKGEPVYPSGMVPSETNESIQTVELTPPKNN
jgi:hypothetical protein